MTHHVEHDTIVIERVAYQDACKLSSKRIIFMSRLALLAVTLLD